MLYIHEAKILHVNSILQYFLSLGTSSSGSKIGNVPLQNNPAVAVPPKVQDIGISEFVLLS